MTKSSLDLLPSWLRPLPVRAALVGLVGAWGGFEAFLGNTIWAALFLGCAVYGAWELLVKPARDGTSGGTKP
jgi:hypothetical protein